ncbi:outer membrane protein [Nioella sp.]|uniref:outer membrane protein n=1 Tax=Nioella sp. TaxID=1912091 RepID=UPI003514027E
MTRLRSALAASAAMATLVAALPALADGPSVSPVIYEPAEIVSEDDFWAGMYAGLFFGMGASSHELFIDIDGADRFTHTEDGIGGTGALVGARAGFDFRLGSSSIFGIGLDASFGDISSNSTTLYRPVAGGQLEVTNDISVDSMYALTGRIGRVVSENTLIYGVAGWAMADMTVNANYSSDAQISGGGQAFSGLPGAFSVEDTVAGATIGLGMETRLGERTSVGVEYRYTDLDGMTIYDPVGVTQVQMPSTALQTFTAGLNVRF